MKNSLLANFAWKFGERITAQVVTLIVTIILARLLDPSVYGVVSVVTIFITIANVFVSDGLGSALIQKKDADELDFSSIFHLSIVISIILYIIIYISAPYISVFFGEGYELLTPVLRVLGIRIIIAGINSVQHAYVSRKMIFKKFFFSTIIGTLISAAVGIYMAYRGFGVWALVGQYLTNTTVDTIVLGLTINWKPKWIFSFKRVKSLFKYGYKVLFSSLLINGYSELRSIVVGGKYSSSDLAFYTKGKQFPSMVITNVNSSIGSVLFPKIANEQDDKTRVKMIVRNSIRFSSFIIIPLMTGLLGMAHTFVSVLLTDKWLDCVVYVRIFCVAYMFQPIHSANIQAIKAIGRSDIVLKLEIIKKSIEIAVLLITMNFGVIWIAIGGMACNILFIVLNSAPNMILIKYSLKEQLIDLAPPILMSIPMLFVVVAIEKIFGSTPLVFVFQILIGAAAYMVQCILFKNHEFIYAKDMLSGFLKNKK